ncbi:MAG: GHKL domain-containing protein [Firmicutes bacterium]|nr:GHKL domain-containing protein [Bacillota bacterium]
MTAFLEEPWFLFIWWLLVNGAMYYLAFDFLLRVNGAKGRRYLPLWLVICGSMTLCALCFQIPGMFFLYVLCLTAFGRLLLKIPWVRLSAPGAIVFTLHTFLEGEMAVILAFLSANVELGAYGGLAQMLLSLASAVLFFLLLSWVWKTYAKALRQPISSYLYVLLLPCAAFLLAVRYGLRLDSPAFAAHLSSFGLNASLTAVLVMTGAMGLCLLMIKVFCQLISLSGHEREAALLEEQLEGQKTYLEEARKRNQTYASFQHDLDNHLLVLSGLLRKQCYEEAAKFAEKLHESRLPLSLSISTGAPALDVLLQEKIGHAQRSGIKVFWDVDIPEGFKGEALNLCAVFANILDNAICACAKALCQEPVLWITTKARGSFLVIEGRNHADIRKGQEIKPGTGLRNVRAIAEKYQGTMELETNEGMFRISVLLCSG